MDIQDVISGVKGNTGTIAINKEAATITVTNSKGKPFIYRLTGAKTTTIIDGINTETDEVVKIQ